MTNPYPGSVPDPEANRQEWLASHPDAAPVSGEAAQAETARQLGDAAPGPGVSGEALGEQMAAAGAQAGLPHEDAMNALMEEIRRLSSQVSQMQVRDQQREAAQIAALGEPILQRYANALRDKLKAHVAANPGSETHFAPQLAAAEKLATAAADAISRGGNDMGQVAFHASALDRFFTRGHGRTAPGHLKHLDMSAAMYDLEQVIEEAARLAPGQSLALTG